MLSNALILSSVLSLASAANFDVAVGQGGNTFTPSTISAQKGDTVTFKFSGSSHDIVQSSFDAPCSPLSGGIFAPVQSKAISFTVTLQNTDPVWFYCSVPGHCNGGMVGVINAPTGQTQSDFAKAAAGAKLVAPSGNSPSGGVLGDGTSSSSAASISATSSRSSSASATSGSSASTQSSSGSAGSASSSSSAGAAPTAIPAALALVAGAFAGLL